MISAETEMDNGTKVGTVGSRENHAKNKKDADVWYLGVYHSMLCCPQYKVNMICLDNTQNSLLGLGNKMSRVHCCLHLCALFVFSFVQASFRPNC